MPKYLLQGNYAGEGVKGLLREGGSGRRATVEKLISAIGGRVETFYYAFGDTDVFLIVDLPDNVTAAALSMAVNATGAVALRATVLLSAEEIDEATKKTVSYRAPGQ
ncbi:MAG TPA: GYD domain-containing protein [Blastocatellia bacterium]|nr:GYD domain-containing protein [Blastocatellia bacterium]